MLRCGAKKTNTEAGEQRRSLRKVFVRNWQKNTCAEASFVTYILQNTCKWLLRPILLTWILETNFYSQLESFIYYVPKIFRKTNL